MNSRLDEIQAAVLRVKLGYLDIDTEKRRTVAEAYLSALSSQSSALTLPYVADYGLPAWHLFVVRTARRGELVKYLMEHGIQSVIHYPVPPHQQAAYPELGGQFLPFTEAIHHEVLSLPFSPVLSPESVHFVSEAISKFPL